MGGLVIETVRPGVQFTPEAADAFRRAEAQVLDEFGRPIDANSTYRSWAKQLGMHNAWLLFVSGLGPYPGHSKAVHPNESFHVSGTALDSDDWGNARIVEILAENGFIRNRLHVPNERHHFEYIRDRDKNIGKPASGGGAAVPSRPKEIRVYDYPRRSDATAKTKSGREVKPGGTFFLHTELGQSTSSASNIVGKLGPYSISVNVYAEGEPGDALEVQLWRVKRGEDTSKSHVQRFTFDDDRLLRKQASFVMNVDSAPISVFVLVTAIRTNKKPLKVTLLDADSRLFTVA